MVASNPNGPKAWWQRAFRTNQSLDGYGSPGLAQGWVHNYDVYLDGSRTTWSPLNLRYPNGGVESLTPQLNSSGVPTGAFSGTPGAPFVVTGVANSTIGSWTSITLTWKNKTQWQFKLVGSTSTTYLYGLDRLTNALGQSLSFNWDSTRRLQNVTDVTSNSVLLSCTYDANGSLASVQDAQSRKRTYSFGIPTSGGYLGVQLLTVSQIAASSTPSPPMQWSYGYSSFNSKPLFASTTVPSPTGTGTATASVVYNSDGRVKENVDANGNRHSYKYYTSKAVVTSKNPQGVLVSSYTQKFEKFRDNEKRVTGTIDAAGNENFIEYSDSANPYAATAVVDASGRRTVMTYDAFGNVLSVKSPRNITTAYTYNYTNFPQGRLVQVQEGTKPAVTLSYFEPSGRVQSVTAPHPNGSGTVTTSYTYNALGDVLTVTSPGVLANRVTTFNYTQDGSYTQTATKGQPLTITNNLGKVTHLRYDARGNVTSVWDALGLTTDITYNIADQPVDVLLPATGQSGNGRTRLNSSYLYLGGPQSSTRVYDEGNALVRTVSMSYGKEGEALSVSGGNEPHSQVYDALYRIKSLTDAAGRVTTYEYDLSGNIRKMSLPGASGTTNKDTVNFPLYNADGQVKQSIDGNGVVSNYSYSDPEGRLTAISYPSSPQQNVSYSYDAYGLPQSVTSQSGTESYGLNASDVLSSVTTIYKKADGTSMAAKTIGYSYYADGSRASMTTPSGNFFYGYDNLGRATGLTNPQSQETTWAYLDNNWLASQRLSNGAVTSYTRNALGQTLGVTTRNGAGTMLSQFGHESDSTLMLKYDAEGSLTKLRAVLTSASNLSGTTDYSYNAKKELTGETSTRNSGYSNSFGYDATGNPTTWNGAARTFNLNNQETTGGTTQFNYDGEGNPTTYKGVSAQFDVNNHLTSYGTLLTSGYRSDGKRAWKQNSSGTRTYFLYDGDAVIAELDGNGNTTFTNTWGANGLVSRRDEGASSTRFYTWDQQGNVAQALDSSGNVIDSYSFTAFGQRTGGSAADPYSGYNGQWGYYTDSETGLILCTYRYYDPSSGRWLTRDPIGYDGGLNLYGYVNNNPINYVDPSGLFLETGWDVVNVGIGGISFGRNIAIGNYGGAVIDGVGLIYDGVATAIPGLPAGASTVIKGIRGANAAANGLSAIAADVASDDGVIYERTSRRTGEKYVGQAKSPERYGKRQGEHDSDKGEEHDYEIIRRAPAGKALDDAEEDEIRRRGGIQSRGGPLANKRHQRCPEKYGGSVPMPY